MHVYIASLLAKLRLYNYSKCHAPYLNACMLLNHNFFDHDKNVCFISWSWLSAVDLHGFHHFTEIGLDFFINIFL